MAGRNAYWDAVRGLAIVAVVAIHATTESTRFLDAPPGFDFGLALRQFVNFAVPIFLGLAGYFAGARPTADAGAYWRSRFLRIGVPYLFWTAVYVVLLKPGDFLAPDDLLQDVIFGEGIGIGYFVIVLLQMVALTPFISRVKTTRAHVALIAVGTIAGLALTYLLQIRLAGTPFGRFPMNAVPFLVWYPFYHLGFLAARNPPPDGLATWLALTAAWAAGVVLSFLEAGWFLSQGLPALAASQLKASSIFASTAFLVMVLIVGSHVAVRESSPLAWLGRHSFFIYLTHLLAFAAIAAPLARVPGLYERQALYILMLTASAIALCSGAALLGKQVIPARLQPATLAP